MRDDREPRNLLLEVYEGPSKAAGVTVYLNSHRIGGLKVLPGRKLLVYRYVRLEDIRRAIREG